MTDFNGVNWEVGDKAVCLADAKDWIQFFYRTSDGHKIGRVPIRGNVYHVTRVATAKPEGVKVTIIALFFREMDSREAFDSTKFQKVEDPAVIMEADERVYEPAAA